MASNPFQSAGLRFVRKFGVAFLWALVWGAFFGTAAYFRVDHWELDQDPRWHVVARWWLESLELSTFDWRARQLGAVSLRSDDVVLVSIDDETVANAAEAEKPDYAARPWPRDLLGALVEQLLKEGASVVLVDESFSDVSAHQCAPCRAEAKQMSDDAKLATRLERHPGRVVLPFFWSAERPKPGLKPLAPFVLGLGERNNAEGVMADVQRVLEARLPAYITPAPGKLPATVWAGVASEEKAKTLADGWSLRGGGSIRPKTGADDENEVDRAWLASAQAVAMVEGSGALVPTQARSIHAPVAPLLRRAIEVGAASLPADADGVVRAVPMVLSAGTTALASAPLQVAKILAAKAPMRIDDGVLKVGERFRVPIDQHGSALIKWDAEDPGRLHQGPVKRSIPAWRLILNMEDDASGVGLRHYDNELKGKVVVLHDTRGPWVATPIGPMPHGAVMAQAISGLLHSHGIVRASPEADVTSTVAFAFMGALLAVAWASLVRRPGWLVWVATLLVVTALHALVARQLFVEQQRWVSMVTPLLALAFTFLAALGYARSLEHGLRDFMQRALGGAVRADIFRRVERDLALMRPERRELSVYFSDIEGFTSVAETKEPKVVVTVLRQYLDLMTELVLAGGGHVDKYLGDGMMAFWGAPVQIEGQIDVACDAALTMQQAFERNRAQWEKVCGRPLVMRAGLDVGSAIVGEMGTSHRVNYTVMGEPVAAAFRLEALAGKYGVKVLVTDAVKRAVTQKYAFRPVDRVRLGKRAEDVQLHELVGARKFMSVEALTRVEVFTRAVEAFEANQIEEAKELFERLASEQPEDELVRRFLAIVRRARV